MTPDDPGRQKARWAYSARMRGPCWRAAFSALVREAVNRFGQTVVMVTPDPVAAQGVASAGGQLHFVGGCTDASCDTTSEAEAYDAVVDTWAPVGPYPHTRRPG